MKFRPKYLPLGDTLVENNHAGARLYSRNGRMLIHLPCGAEIGLSDDEINHLLPHLCGGVMVKPVYGELEVGRSYPTFTAEEKPYVPEPTGTWDVCLDDMGLWYIDCGVLTGVGLMGNAVSRHIIMDIVDGTETVMFAIPYSSFDANIQHRVGTFPHRPIVIDEHRNLYGAEGMDITVRLIDHTGEEYCLDEEVTYDREENTIEIGEKTYPIPSMWDITGVSHLGRNVVTLEWCIRGPDGEVTVQVR